MKTVRAIDSACSSDREWLSDREGYWRAYNRRLHDCCNSGCSWSSLRLDLCNLDNFTLDLFVDFFGVGDSSAGE